MLHKGTDQNVIDVANTIRSARTSLGLTKPTLAERAGVSVHAVWEVENRNNGTVALLSALCTALDVRFAGLPRGRGFGEQARKLRVRRGWSQDRLAERAGVSAPVIARLEQGNARIATLTAVLAVLAPKARVAQSVGRQWSGSAIEIVDLPLSTSLIAFTP